MSTCQVSSEGQEQMIKSRRSYNKACIKCKCDKGNLAVRGLVYCRRCLSSLVVQKFKKAVDDVIPSDDAPSAVLSIAFSGGLGSSLLFHLVTQHLCASVTRRTRRHHWEKVYLIHIEESAAYNALSDNVYEEVDLMDIETNHPNVTVIRVPIEHSFEQKPPTDPARSRLQEYLRSLPTQTSKRDGINLLKRQLIERTAHSLGITHILFGRTLTSMSAALLSNVCTGRGFNILDEFQSNCDGVISFNPLKDLGSKECGAYAWWNGIPVLSSPIRRASSLSGGASISQLTSHFIVGLDKDYPSTVSTILKTCNKVVPKGNSDSTCRLCNRNMQKPEELAVPTLVTLIRAAPLARDRNDFCYGCETLLTSSNSRTAEGFNLSHLRPVWVDEG
ncbi:hypothetical protein CPB86DRAFT_827658 [Serendipita vermifera]|nr:hypothetical protein CPB86DRAFT_827658 [Serendipita vermifera]